jgi:ComF family protein
MTADTPSYGSAAGGVARGWRERLLHFLLPAPCVSCQEKADGGAFGLCASCCRLLQPAPAGLAMAGPALAGTESYRRLLWGWNYAPPFDQVIAALKFRRLDYLGSQLGAELGRRFAAELAEVEVVTAVPLGWWRRLGRGYDQAEAIATAVAPLCGKKADGSGRGRPLRRLLERRRATTPQSLAGREERRKNLQGAFAATAAAKAWRGCHILLVDDVVTTGATLEAAAGALLAAGVGAVTALVAGRTPPPDEAAARRRE